MSAGSDVELSQFDGLSIDQQRRLSALLDECLGCLESGQPVDRQRLIAGNPDLAAPLQVYLESLDFLQDAAAGFLPAALPPEASADETVPTQVEGEKRLGDFRIVGEIGRGGMGVVYEAWQISLDRRVALKVLPFASLLDGKQIARFRNEAQAAARLHHPNIVPVFAVGTERGVHYYAMQCIDGQPLDRVIAALHQAARSRSPRRDAVSAVSPPAAPRPASEEDESSSDTSASGASVKLTSAYVDDAPRYFRNVAKLGVQAAAALHAAHQEGIVHRDIKPSNLLLDDAGKLWVADFGLARCRADSELTQSGEFVGTMRYMSPEQARGSSAVVDHRSDVYSLGVTLYELLTLRQAVRGQDPVAIVRRLDSEEPYAPRQWDVNIPVDLETIVLKAIAKSPDGRYPTALGLADDLQRFLSNEPIIARRPTLMDRIGKWTWRHKRAAGTAACVVLLAMIGLAIGTGLLMRQSQRTATALTAAQENYQQYRRQLARTKNHMAMLQEQQGDARGAQATFEEAARLQREIVAEQPTDQATLRDLSTTLNNIGFFQSHGDASRAAIAYGESIDVLRRLSDLAPTRLRVQQDLALATSNLGALYRRQGDPRRAVELLSEACEMFETAGAAIPPAAESGHDLAVGYNNLGMAHTDLGQLAAAEQSFRAALRATRPNIGQPTSATMTASQLSSLGGIYNNLGLVQEKHRRLSQAAESYQQAVHFQRLAHEQSPHVARFRELLDRHYAHGGRIMRQLGHFRQAADWVAARQSLWPRDARHLWSVTEDWLLLARAVNGEAADVAELNPAARQHWLQAVSTLRQAIALGLKPDEQIRQSNAAKVLGKTDDVGQWLAASKASS